MAAGALTTGMLTILVILVVALAGVFWWGYQIGKSEREERRRGF